MYIEFHGCVNLFQIIRGKSFSEQILFFNILLRSILFEIFEINNLF